MMVEGAGGPVDVPVRMKISEPPDVLSKNCAPPPKIPTPDGENVTWKVHDEVGVSVKPAPGDAWLNVPEAPQVLFTPIYRPFVIVTCVTTKFAVPVFVSVTVWLGLLIRFCGTKPTFKLEGEKEAIGAAVPP